MVADGLTKRLELLDLLELLAAPAVFVSWPLDPLRVLASSSTPELLELLAGGALVFRFFASLCSLLGPTPWRDAATPTHQKRRRGIRVISRYSSDAAREEVEWRSRGGHAFTYAVAREEVMR